MSKIPTPAEVGYEPNTPLNQSRKLIASKLIESRGQPIEIQSYELTCSYDDRQILLKELSQQGWNYNEVSGDPGEGSLIKISAK